MVMMAILVSGCGGQLPNGILGDENIDIKGTAVILGTLDLPSLQSGLARVAAYKTSAQDAGNTVISGIAVQPSQFTVHCGAASARVNSDGTWKISGVTPGKNITIRATSDNIEFMSSIAEIFPNQIIANARVNSSTTAEGLIREQLRSSLPGDDSISPLREDVLALAAELEDSILMGRHLTARVTELETSRKILEKSVEKMVKWGRQGIRKGTIEIWRLADSLPEAADFDENGDGFLSLQEFTRLRQFMSISMPASDDSRTSPVLCNQNLERGIATSAISRLDQQIPQMDNDDDGYLTPGQIEELISSLMKMVQPLPSAANGSEVSAFMAGGPLSSDVISGSESLPTQTMLAVAQAPDLFFPNSSDDPDTFDQKLAGFIVALEGMTQSRVTTTRFSMGLLETEISAGNSAVTDSSAAGASAATIAASAASKGIMSSDEVIGVAGLIQKYPGAASLDRDGDGWLRGNEIIMLRSLLPGARGTADSWNQSGNTNSDNSGNTVPEVDSGKTATGETAVPDSTQPCIAIMPLAAVENVMGILENAESMDTDMDGFLKLQELSDMAGKIRSCISIY